MLLPVRSFSTCLGKLKSERANSCMCPKAVVKDTNHVYVGTSTPIFIILATILNVIVTVIVGVLPVAGGGGVPPRPARPGAHGASQAAPQLDRDATVFSPLGATSCPRCATIIVGRIAKLPHNSAERRRRVRRVSRAFPGNRKRVECSVASAGVCWSGAHWIAWICLLLSGVVMFCPWTPLLTTSHPAVFGLYEAEGSRDMTTDSQQRTVHRRGVCWS